MFFFSEVVGTASEGTFKLLSGEIQKKATVTANWYISSASEMSLAAVFLEVMEKGLVVPV